MKTILVCYKSDLAEVNEYEKRYTFNTSDEVTVGDVLKSESYKTNMVVVDILEKNFTYFNLETGDLKNEKTSSRDFLIKELKINRSNNNTVYATKINRSVM